MFPFQRPSEPFMSLFLSNKRTSQSAINGLTAACVPRPPIRLKGEFTRGCQTHPHVPLQGHKHRMSSKRRFQRELIHNPGNIIEIWSISIIIIMFPDFRKLQTLCSRLIKMRCLDSLSALSWWHWHIIHSLLLIDGSFSLSLGLLSTAFWIGSNYPLIYYEPSFGLFHIGSL